MQWFRFYSEFRSDPKLSLMTPHHQWAFIILLCLASDNSTRGRIDDLTDEEIAYQLRMPVEDWQTLKAKFKVKGMIDWDESGIIITHWNKRQYQSDNSTERVRKHRQQKHSANSNSKETGMKRFSNVTETPPDTETETEAETETDPKQNTQENNSLCARAEISSETSKPVLQQPKNTSPSNLPVKAIAPVQVPQPDPMHDRFDYQIPDPFKLANDEEFKAFVISYLANLPYSSKPRDIKPSNAAQWIVKARHNPERRDQLFTLYQEFSQHGQKSAHNPNQAKIDEWLESRKYALLNNQQTPEQIAEELEYIDSHLKELGYVIR